ncbi:hypothetical protein KR009_003620 [Drosophila setifemur]|nr:hypothetical protein KR009_003620 [Drosophila setifemur]
MIALIGLGLVLVLCPSSVYSRSYSNGLIFYELNSHTPYLPPTVSVSRGRNLASVKYSEKGSIWSTFGQPCECSGPICGCCAGLKVDQYQFDQKVCANVTFVPRLEEAQLEVYLNGRPSSKYGISLRNPSPFCIPVMMGVPMAMCVQMTDVMMVGNNLNMCMDFVVRMATTDLFEMHFQCMRMGLDGLQYVDKNGKPVLPSNGQQADDEVVDGDGDDEEEEYGEYAELEQDPSQEDQPLGYPIPNLVQPVANEILKVEDHPKEDQLQSYKPIAHPSLVYQLQKIPPQKIEAQKIETPNIEAQKIEAQKIQPPKEDGLKEEQLGSDEPINYQPPMVDLHQEIEPQPTNEVQPMEDQLKQDQPQEDLQQDKNEVDNYYQPQMEKEEGVGGKDDDKEKEGNGEEDLQPEPLPIESEMLMASDQVKDPAIQEEVEDEEEAKEKEKTPTMQEKESEMETEKETESEKESETESEKEPEKEREKETEKETDPEKESELEKETETEPETDGLDNNNYSESQVIETLTDSIKPVEATKIPATPTTQMPVSSTTTTVKITTNITTDATTNKQPNFVVTNNGEEAETEVKKSTEEEEEGEETAEDAEEEAEGDGEEEEDEEAEAVETTSVAVEVENDSNNEINVDDDGDDGGEKKSQVREPQTKVEGDQKEREEGEVVAQKVEKKVEKSAEKEPENEDPDAEYAEGDEGEEYDGEGSEVEDGDEEEQEEEEQEEEDEEEAEGDMAELGYGNPIPSQSLPATPAAKSTYPRRRLRSRPLKKKH